MSLQDTGPGQVSPAPEGQAPKADCTPPGPAGWKPAGTAQLAERRQPRGKVVTATQQREPDGRPGTAHLGAAVTVHLALWMFYHDKIHEANQLTITTSKAKKKIRINDAISHIPR